MNLLRLLLSIAALSVCCPCLGASTYTYDSLNRLTAVNYGNGKTLSYSYDSAGNRQTSLVIVPATLMVQAGSPQFTTVGTAFSQVLQVKAVDFQGNGVGNVMVAVDSPSIGSSANCVSPAATDMSGTTQISCTANTIAGSYSVTVSTDGVVVPAVFSLTNTPAVATTIVAQAGAAQSTQVGAGFATALQVRVTDTFGNGVGGAPVVFAPPATGASAVCLSAVATDTSGLTQTTCTANTIAGSYSINATTSGVVAPAEFSLTNLPAPASTITAQGGTPQSTAIGTGFGTPLQVQVTDSYGNGIIGKTVNFVPPASGASASCGAAPATGATGLTQTTCIANAIAGAYSIDATVTGIAAPAMFNLTNSAVAGPTATQLGASSNPAIFKRNVILTATVTGSTPTGLIDFKDGGTSIGSCSAQPLAGSQATCQTTGLAMGSHSIEAVYAGDGQNVGSVSPPLVLGIYALFDADASGQVDPITDGILIIRHMFGLTGSALIGGVTALDAHRDTASTIGSYLDDAGILLDVDGNGHVDALTDGLLILRYLLGQRGDALIQGAIGTGALRKSSTEIADYIGGWLQ